LKEVFMMKALIRRVKSWAWARGPAPAWSLDSASTALLLRGSWNPQASQQGEGDTIDPSPCIDDAPPILEREAAIDRMGGSIELYEQLIPIFREDLSRTVEIAGAALSSDGDRELAQRQLHTLKGTAGTLGAWRLATAAHATEVALASSKDARSALRGLHEAVEETRAALDTTATPAALVN
jgi:HPt (histidine-containing phosphotransfer) domain-containing protein